MSKNLKALFGEDHLLDEKSISFLTDALEKNNLPGFDYIEFKQSMASLAKLNIDENRDTPAKYGIRGIPSSAEADFKNHPVGVLHRKMIRGK